MSHGFKPSPQQKRIWNLRHAGSLDGQAVLRCTIPAHPKEGEIAERLADLIDRHEILRTRLDRVEGYTDPLQFIAARGEWICREIDRREGMPGSMASDGDRQAIDRPHVDLCLQPDGTASLEIRASSEMLDSRSLLLLARYLLGLSSPPEGDGLLQYADVSAWLRDMLAAEDAEEARRYWQAAQASAKAALRRISFDRETPAVGGAATVRRPVGVSDELAARARQVALETDVSLEAVLLTAWLELLRRLGGGEGQSCSVAFDGASGEELAGMLGPLTRFLPVCAPPGSCPVVEAIRSVQKALDSGRAFQECCFVEGDADRAPYGFEFNACEGDEASRWRIHSLLSELEDWRILLSVCEDSSGIQAVLDYDPDAFREAAVDAIAEQWLALLGAMIDPDRPIQDVALASPAVTAWARTHGEGPRRERPGTLLDWLASAGEKYGEQRVECPSGDIRLADLDRCANALAQDLVARGLKPGQFVGIHIGRSADFVLAALAAVKAGAAYVPLDVAAPASRLAEMLSRVPFATIVADDAADLAPPIRQHPGLVPLVRGPRPRSEQAPRVQVDPESPLYVLFTSGSTGVPKPVVIPHRALLNHMAWMIETFSFDPADRFLLRTATTFDASVWEMWAPLLVGAGMVIAGQDEDHDIHRLLGRLREGRVSVAQFVPSLLGLLVDTGRLAECESLRLLFCGGEALGPALLRSAQDSTPAELVNLYGPTECCIDSAFWRPAEAGARGTVAIGRPIDNMSLYVLDSGKRPAGIGIAGELCIGGSGLFSGYLGLEEKTSEALFPNPFGEGLLYRTGDQARLGEDGLFEFVGRLDDQVKLNGYRIELGEIDTAIERVAGGARAATVVTADRQLVAFVASADGELDSNRVRRDLEQVLPAYMIPSHIDRLEFLPLRPNGKVDRRALVALASEQRRRGIHVPPEGEIETQLAAIWSKVLGIDRIGVTDSFFALGGDSIRSIQIVYEARAQGLDVSVREILRLRTIRDIAAAMGDRPAASPRERAAALPEVSRMDLVPAALRARVTDCYPASHMQRFVVGAYESDEARRGIFHAQQGFSVSDRQFDPNALAEAVRKAAGACNFRTRFLNTPQGPHQLLLRDSAVEIGLERSVGPIMGRFAAIVEEDRRRPFNPFDLDRPLLRVHVLSAGDDREHRILISNHHAVQDGWGNVEFLNEVAGHLAGATASGPSANGCKELVAIEACEPRLGPGRISELVGPISSPPRPIGIGPCRSRIVPVAADLAAAVVAKAGHLQVRPKSLILAAYYASLSKALGLRDPVVGVVANGRDDQLSDPLRAMGLFWYLAPFRLLSAQRLSPGSLPGVEEQLLKAEASARAFWGEPGMDGSLLTQFTFNFVQFHNWSGGLDQAGWRMDHRLDDFGADVGLAVGLAPEAETMLTLILDYSPDQVGEGQIAALEGDLVRMLEDVAQGSLSS